MTDKAKFRQVADSIWCFSRPFLRFNTLKFGGRATAVRFPNGDLFLVSPIKPDDATKTQLDSIGTVKYLVAPDFEHHMFLKSYVDWYPDAQVIGVKGLPEKKAKEGIKFDFIFDGKNNTKSFGPNGEIETWFFPGHRNKELAFLHKPTKTLIEADLAFNLPAYEQYEGTGVDPTSGILTKIFISLIRPGSFIGMRLEWYGGSKTRDQMAQDVAVVSGWDFDRLIPCHGDIIETCGKAFWNKRFKWYLAYQRKKAN